MADIFISSTTEDRAWANWIGLARGRERQAHRWGKTNGKIAFHGGKVDIERPRLRGFDGKEHPPQRADFV